VDGLRTLTVLEHEVIPIIDGDGASEGTPLQTTAPLWLTGVEAEALLRLNSLRPGFCERISGGVKLAQYCGIVRLQSCVVEVLPKVGMVVARLAGELDRSCAALLTMLRHARKLKIIEVGVAPQQVVRTPLLDIFIESFLKCALEQARRGLLFRYVPQADDLPVLKGRFQAHGHLRNNLARPHLLHCEYDEFTGDNIYNRAVRATLDICRTWITQAATQRLWFEVHARFASITSTPITAENVARLPRDRTTRRYELLLTWCEWLLAMKSPAMSSGSKHAPGLLFDMNKLFETYVSGLEEAASGDAFVVETQGPKRALAMWGADEAFQLKPDITIWHVGSNGAPGNIDRVLDAKWKRLDPKAPRWGVKEADVYQLLAYSLRYQCRTLELIYPQYDPAIPGGSDGPVFTISAHGLDQQIEVRVKTVSLWTLPGAG
jgi:5-methylcytosine-specific restriction enzyme subunit McrC